VTSETSTLSRAPPSESSYVRLEKTRLSVSSSGCASIDGELVPITDDDPESTDSPASLFFDRSPSDSAMGVSGPRPSGTEPPGLLGAHRCRPRDEVGSETKGRCFLHEVAHILSALPRSIRPRETPTSAHLGDAEDRDHALAAATAVEVDRPTWPKVAEELRFDLDHLRASPRTRLPTGFTSRPRRRSTRASRRCVSGPG